jgi:hypothetical protein
LGQCNTRDWRDIIKVQALYDKTIGYKKDGTVIITGYDGDWKNIDWKNVNWCNVIEVSGTCGSYAILYDDGTVYAAGGHPR